MKVTRPGSTTPSMGGGDGRYPSNPYGVRVYGRQGAGGRTPAEQKHQVDVNSEDLPETDGELPFHTTDIADVLGIPHEQVTSAVEQAIGRLMVRINGLSENLDEMKKHQAHLARMEGRDPFTGALSRPTFLQILENEMAVIGSDRTTRTLLLCEVYNLEDILQRYGQDCKGPVFNFVRRVISDFIMPPHQLGYLGCNDFAAMLYNVDYEDARQRVEAITRRIQAHPLVHNDSYITVKSVFGIYLPKRGDTAQTAMNAVDSDLRAKKEMILAQLHRIPRGV